jgi:hypothetical protein
VSRNPATLPVAPETVTVLGSRVRADEAAWAGLDWTGNVVVREQSTLMRWAVGNDAPPDHHLDVPWMHPDDRASMADYPDGWCVYRVRPRRKGYRFERALGEPTGWRLVRA